MHIHTQEEEELEEQKCALHTPVVTLSLCAEEG